MYINGLGILYHEVAEIVMQYVKSSPKNIEKVKAYFNNYQKIYQYVYSILFANFPCKLEEIREIRMLVNLLRLMPRERRKILKSLGAVEAARFSHIEEQNSTPTTLGQKRKNENANLKAERIEKRRMKSEKLKSDLEAQLKAINKKFGHIDTLKKEEKKQTKN